MIYLEDPHYLENMRKKHKVAIIDFPFDLSLEMDSFCINDKHKLGDPTATDLFKARLDAFIAKFLKIE